MTIFFFDEYCYKKPTIMRYAQLINYKLIGNDDKQNTIIKETDD